MTKRKSTLPPSPWSARMKNAGEVLQAYLDLGQKHRADLAAAQRLHQIESQKAIQGKINATELQIDAAIVQMWIIRDEELAQ